MCSAKTVFPEIPAPLLRQVVPRLGPGSIAIIPVFSGNTSLSQGDTPAAGKQSAWFIGTVKMQTTKSVFFEPYGSLRTF